MGDRYGGGGGGHYGGGGSRGGYDDRRGGGGGGDRYGGGGGSRGYDDRGSRVSENGGRCGRHYADGPESPRDPSDEKTGFLSPSAPRSSSGGERKARHHRRPA